jgi:hypothetical protein
MWPPNWLTVECRLAAAIRLAREVIGGALSQEAKRFALQWGILVIEPNMLVDFNFAVRTALTGGFQPGSTALAALPVQVVFGCDWLTALLFCHR